VILTQTIKQLAKLLRIDQWVKNLFVFIPAFFAARLLVPEVFIDTFLAFLAFCLVSAGVYVFNDLCDLEQDKLHPEKKHRPIASGWIKQRNAWWLLAILSFMGLALAAFVHAKVLLGCSLYVLLNIAYSLRLKHFALLDVSLIGLGFLFRVFVGAAAALVPVSHWLIVLTFLLALVLGFAKRRAEYLLSTTGGSTRQALEGYNLPFIDSAMLVSSTIAVVAYLMYCFSPDVTQRIGSDRIYYTAFFVMMGLLRYLQLTFVYNRTESPTRALLTDRNLQCILLGWVACFFWLLYWKKHATDSWIGKLLSGLDFGVWI
jgi:decaprenyl-phosphate phosphoribosyltransferase